MQTPNGNLFEFGEFRLDATKKVLWRDGEVVPLPLKAVELLSVLIENRGEVLSNNDLINRVWKDSFVEESVLTQNIYLLRKTLKNRKDKKVDLIKNVPRRGYLFNGEVREIVDSTNGAELVIERHLFEKISLEETDVKDTETELTVLPTTAALPRRRIAASIFAVAILLGLTAGAYFYFRADSRQTATTVAPPIKLKTVSAPSSVKTLAILPLKSSDENFASSFSNDLAVRLGSLNKFTVKPFALVKEYEKNGAAVLADFVFDGDIWMKNNLFGATVRLLNTKTGAEIWMNKFEFDNLVQLQDAIANQVSKKIFNQLTDAEQATVSKRLPTNLTAYENFQTGSALWRNRKDGTVYFQKAIELDANFARAYVGLASVKMMTGGGKDSPETREAETLLAKAFEIDENSTDAYAVQGFIRIFHYRDWEGAEKSFQNALALDANNLNAHHWLAVFFSIHRRLDEAKTEMHKALEIDPTNPTLLADLGQLFYFAGDNETAKRYCQQTLALDANHEFANYYLNKLNQPSEIGDKETVLKQLNEAADKGDFMILYINIDPRYDSLRDDARFQAILQKMNLSN